MYFSILNVVRLVMLYSFRVSTIHGNADCIACTDPMYFEMVNTFSQPKQSILFTFFQISNVCIIFSFSVLIPRAVRIERSLYRWNFPYPLY